MADKEERILCNSYDGIQAQLMANNNIGMTRQEAIEVIKKSLEQIQCWPNSFNDIIAETALNALLGDKKWKKL